MDKVIAVWRDSEHVRREKVCRTLTEARAVAVRVMGMDDRMTVAIFDAATKQLVGKVTLFAGVPCWNVTGRPVRTIARDGNLTTDMFDY